MSTSTDHLVTQNATFQRRFYPRINPSVLIYVAFGPNNLGMLLNVSENGLLVSTPQGLDLNSVYRVSLRLNGVPNAIKVHVRTVWTTESQKRSGIQLLDLTEYDREQIRKWGTLQLSPKRDLRTVVPARKRRVVTRNNRATARARRSRRRNPSSPPRSWLHLPHSKICTQMGRGTTSLLFPATLSHLKKYTIVQASAHRTERGNGRHMFGDRMVLSA